MFNNSKPQYVLLCGKNSRIQINYVTFTHECWLSVEYYKVETLRALVEYIKGAAYFNLLLIKLNTLLHKRVTLNLSIVNAHNTAA